MCMRLAWRNPSWPRKPSATGEPHACPGKEKYEPHCSLQSCKKKNYSPIMAWKNVYSTAIGCGPACRKDGRHWHIHIHSQHCVRSATTTCPPPTMATCHNVILCLEHLSVQPAFSSWHPTARLYIVSPNESTTNIKLRCRSHPTSMLENLSCSAAAFLAASWPWQHGKKKLRCIMH